MNSIPTVAVSGIGCLCAAGINLQACLQSIFDDGCTPRPPTRFSSDHAATYPVFEVPQNVSSGGAARNPDTLLTADFALTATLEALADAGLSRGDLQAKRIGVCIGTTVGSAMNNEDFYREYRQGRHPDMNAITRFLNSNPAQAIGREFGLSGPCQTIVNACSSGTDALGVGSSWVRSGMCDMVLAGGADELCRVTYNGFISLMITDDSPCKPFDAERKGLNLGEGASILVLEADDLCQRRHHSPRAFMLGYGSACDAYHLTAPAPDGASLKTAIATALAACEKSVDDVAFVNAHGTGTPNNDRVESRVLNELLPGVPFLSTKAYTGHTLGAAGAIEAALTVACLEEGKIPTSAGFAKKDPELPAHPVQHETAVSGAVAISQSLAFGGNNSAIIFGKENH
jgi:3-oxoacyl-[acyl-carrier-protein] synthase-1/3-oxoacyl-[acyl-carrier-protein] synthase II